MSPVSRTPPAVFHGRATPERTNMQTVNIGELPQKARTRRFSKPLIFFTVLLQLAAAGLIGIMLVYHGPFNAIRSYIVGTAMESKSHQFLATWFLSDSEIQKIIHSGGNVSSDSQVVAANANTSAYNSGIEIDSINNDNYSGYMMIISNPLRVHVGHTKYLGTRGELTSEMAARYNAVAAINGGGFHDATGSAAYGGNGGLPTCFAISGGQVVYRDNGFTDTDKTQAIGIDTKGNLIVGEHSIKELQSMGVTEALQFENDNYPTTLIVNGKAQFNGTAGSGRTARTAIGQRKSDNALLLLVLDGRTLTKTGATLGDVRDIMLKYGANTAAELDGGGSTTMVSDNKVINTPCDNVGERLVATCFYVEK